MQPVFTNIFVADQASYKSQIFNKNHFPVTLINIHFVVTRHASGFAVFKCAR
jgi:hypothetical protein